MNSFHHSLSCNHTHTNTHTLIHSFTHSHTHTDPSWNVLVKMAYFLLVTFVVRSRFYFVFVLNDSISNTAGLGFEGYDKQNNPKWELASNVDAVQMEFAMNLRNAINSWNLSSARWLRRSV